MRGERWISTVALLTLAGCAVSPERFRSERYSLSNTQVCRTAISSAAEKDPSFNYDVWQEAQRRGLTGQDCRALINEQNVGIGVAAILGAAIIAASRGGGGGGYNPAAYDTEWDWDQFYNEYRQLVWACRGVQTGQFAEAYRCSGKWQTDARWPSKEAR